MRSDVTTSSSLDRNRILSVAMLALVTGCGVVVPRPVPTSASGPPLPAQLAVEEREPRDLPTPTSGPVSLEALLAFADARSPAIQVARAQIARGDAAIEGAETLVPYNPQVSVGVGPRIRPDGTGIDVQASVQQQLEIAGERGTRIRAAEALRDRLGAELDAVRWQIHWEIHAVYHRALVARERAEAAAQALAFQNRLLEVALERKEAGEISALPVRIAEGDAAQARVASVRAGQAYLALRLRLARLSGWPVETPPEPQGHLELPRRAPPLGRIVALAEKHQPRLHVLAQTVAEAEAKAEAAARDGWPEPTIGVQLNREAGPENSADYVVLGTLGVPLPIFQRNQRERAEAKAEAVVARAEAEAFDQQLEAQLALAASAVDAAAERAEVYGTEILPTFAKNLAMLERAYELGEIDILEVAVARERFMRVQGDALDAYDDYFQSVADLEALVGADLWTDTEH